MIHGGPVGVGIGNSIAKLPGYLPLSWTDNIFAIVGEELGLLGALLVILLFALFAYRGLRIALMSRDSFGTLLATGITSIVILQALLNAAVVVAVAPATGVTLPFISYGGSSLVTVLGAVGILLSISRYNSQTAGVGGGSGNMAYARFNFGWRDGGARVSRTGRRGTTRSSRSNSGSKASAAPASAKSKSATATKRRPSTRKKRTGTRRTDTWGVTVRDEQTCRDQQHRSSKRKRRSLSAGTLKCFGSVVSAAWNRRWWNGRESPTRASTRGRFVASIR